MQVIYFGSCKIKLIVLNMQIHNCQIIENIKVYSIIADYVI